MAYSTDGGINWTGLGTSIFTNAGWSVCWNGNKWIAGGEGGKSVAWSFNGIDWYTLTPNPMFQSGACYGVASNSYNSVRLLDSQFEVGTYSINNNNKLDIVSEGYYNSGFNNVNIAIKAQELQ